MPRNTSGGPSACPPRMRFGNRSANEATSPRCPRRRAHRGRTRAAAEQPVPVAFRAEHHFPGERARLECGDDPLVELEPHLADFGGEGGESLSLVVAHAGHSTAA